MLSYQRFLSFSYFLFWNRWWSLQSDWLSAVWFIYESHNHICSKSRYLCSKPRHTVAPCFISHHFPGGLFPGILPSITNGTWSPCSRVWPSQTLWQIWWPFPHRHPWILLRYRLCQTKLCLKPFSKVTSHSSPAFARPLSLRSIIRLHSGEWPQMTVFIILFFRQRLARWRLLSGSSSFFLSKRVFGLYTI